MPDAVKPGAPMRHPDFAATAARAQLRRLGPADLAAYKTLRDVALRLHPDAFTADPEIEAARSPESYLGRLGLSEPLGGTALLGALVAQGGGAEQLVGSAGLERETRGKLRHIAALINLIVLPEWQGHGLGRALVDACVAEARRAQDLEMLTVNVSADAEPVLRLYAQAGFERYGLLPRALRLRSPQGAPQYVDKVQLLLML